MGSEENESVSSAGDNEIAIEVISEKLSEVTALAEELDQALHSAQQDCSILTSSVTSSEPETVVSVKTVMDNEVSLFYKLKVNMFYCEKSLNNTNIIQQQYTT